MPLRTTKRRVQAALAAGAVALTGLLPAASAAGAATSAVPGLTPTTVTVGNVTVLTGPIPGLFEGAQYGVAAYLAYINSKGGVNGRKILMKNGDDGLSCNQDTNVTQQMVGQVFAFVGNFSTFDNCGATVLAKNPSVADIAYGLSPAVQQLPNNYSFSPNPPGYRQGPFKYYLSKYPKANKIGALVTNTSGGLLEWKEQSAMLKATGYKIAYERDTNPTETQFTSDIIRMRNAGVSFLWLLDEDITTDTRIINAAHQQGWRPQVIYSPTSYDGHFFKLLGDPAAAEGMLADQTNALFLGEDKSTVPEVGLFLQWLKKLHPGFSPDIYSFFGWNAAALFVQAFRAEGKHPTRQGLLTQLKKIHNFTDNGMLPAVDVGRKKPPTCYVVIQVHNGKWVRVSPTKTGFRCQPGGYYYYKS